jgi:SHS2 domain-containing protein
MFETFEHTADLGLRVRASDLNELFAEAGRGLTSVLIDNPDAIRPERQAVINLDGTEIDYLLFDWLNELLYRFESEHWLFAEFQVAVNDHGLTATVCGEPLTTDRHQPAHEVKAITYHHLKVERTPSDWLAEVIVDI